MKLTQVFELVLFNNVLIINMTSAHDYNILYENSLDVLSLVTPAVDK